MQTIARRHGEPCAPGAPRPARRSRRRAREAVLRISRLAVIAVLLAAAVVMTAGHVTGWSGLIVRSGSMEPAVPLGSLVLARPVAPGAVALGDVIAVPGQVGGRPVLVLHRVTALTTLHGQLHARLKGDANAVPDPEPVPLDQPVARPVVVVPFAGYALAGLRQAFTPSGLLLVALGVLGLVLIWRDRTPAP